MSSINDVRVKSIEVELGGKVRHLLFDLNAFAELEDLYDNIDDVMKKMSTGSIKAIRALLWAGLVHEDENLTVKDVGKMVNTDNMKTIAETLGKALTTQMPKNEDEVDGGPEKN